MVSFCKKECQYKKNERILYSLGGYILGREHVENMREILFRRGKGERGTERKSPADRVYQEVLRQIVAGEIGAGERLPAEPLADQMGCSRMPVREALQRLASEGIVVITPGCGARLVSPSPREIRDVYAVRAVLEDMAVRLALKEKLSVLLAALEEILHHQEKARERSYEDYLRQDMAFHRTLAEWGGNAFLAASVENALAASWVYRMLFEPRRGAMLPPSPEEEHRKILEALRRRNEEDVAALVKRHILRGIEDLGLSGEEEPEALGSV
jgi:DNA-binding GntR family transcriptional regulator